MTALQERWERILILNNLSLNRGLGLVRPTEKECPECGQLLSSRKRVCPDCDVELPKLGSHNVHIVYVGGTSDLLNQIESRSVTGKVKPKGQGAQ